MDGEVYIYPHHGIPHRGVVDPPRTTTLRLRQPTVRTVLGSRIPRLPISFTPRSSLFPSNSSCHPFQPSSFPSYPPPVSTLPPPHRPSHINRHAISFHFPFRFSFLPPIRQERNDLLLGDFPSVRRYGPLSMANCRGKGEEARVRANRGIFIRPFETSRTTDCKQLVRPNNSRWDRYWRRDREEANPPTIPRPRGHWVYGTIKRRSSSFSNCKRL